MNLDAEVRERLENILTRIPEGELADEFSVNPKTLRRWRDGETIQHLGVVNHALLHLEQYLRELAQARPEPKFDFIDLFAGIGGTRLGFERAGGRCVYTSEWDRFSTETYRKHFGADHPIAGDIREVSPIDIPDHDVLIAGFPCQPFSIAGVSKKKSLGRAHGFDCDTQGTLFFYIEKIIEAKRPAAFMLENVKNLRGHDKGRTFEVIRHTLENKLGYKVQWRIIDGKAFTPQHRERIFIVGFREDTGFDIDSIKIEKSNLKMGDILEPAASVDKKYILSKKLWSYLKNYAAKHKAKGNGFGYGLVGPDDTCRTLSARYYKDGSEILISRGPRANPRRLTPRECARLMGFPDSFEIPVSDTQAYKQFGNSVVVPVVETVAKAMTPYIVTAKANEAQKRQVAMAL